MTLSTEEEGCVDTTLLHGSKCAAGFSMALLEQNAPLAIKN